MMFRSLFFVAPLLVAGDCAGDSCTEQTAMLQLNRRDETKELMHRAQSSQQTLRTLEENLMGKQDVDTAMCTYYLKSVHNHETLSPCEKIDLLQTTFHESLKDFKEFDEIMKDTIGKALAPLSSLAHLESNPAQALQSLGGDFALGLTAEGEELKKLTETMKAAEAQLGGANSAFETALQSLVAQAEASFTATVTEVEADIKKVLSTEEVENLTAIIVDLRLVVQEVMTAMASGDAQAVQAALGDAEDRLLQYVRVKFADLMNGIGEQFALFWTTVLNLPDTAENPFASVQWTEPKEVKKLEDEKVFWRVANGYLDLVEHVEEPCQSVSFNLEKLNDFEPRKICKSNDKPLCVDEFLYLMAEISQDTDGVCDEVKRKSWGERRQPVTYPALGISDEAAGDEFVYCEKVDHVKKACEIIEKAEKKKARR